MSSVSGIETQSRSADSSILIKSIVTGQLAGLIMAVAVMAVFVIFYGKSPLYPVQVIGSTIFGGEALQGFHLGAVIAGLLIHQLGPSVAWGIAFALAVSKAGEVTVQKSLALGLAIGVVSMIDVYVLVPMVMNALHGIDYWNQEVPIGWDWVAHLVFGISFALYPKVSNYMNQK